MAMRNKVTLCEERGETSIYIDAEITDDGTLQLSGQDIGRVPEEFWGDSDYEYWLVIPADQKDRVLLALLEELYRGNRRAVSEFQSFLKERDIPCAFHSWA
jgi:hypothetical protein